MVQWRPVENNCLYVIPDIHGSINLLDKILKRILPLRKDGPNKDQLVFLGDYIDRHRDSNKVLDRIIELKTKYPDQVIALRGNHEAMMLKSLNLIPGRNVSLQDLTLTYQMWLRNGGFETVLGYMDRAGISTKDITVLERYRVPDIIPPQHIELLQFGLQNYWEHDNYLFVHAGLDPMQEVNKQDAEVLLWDRSLYGSMVRNIKVGQTVPWSKVIVTGHNGTSDQPVIHPHFLMLDCCSPKRLLVVELRSMTGYMARPDKNRMLKVSLMPKIALPPKTGVFRRVG